MFRVTIASIIGST